jgi:hypothetical protein
MTPLEERLEAAGQRLRDTLRPASLDDAVSRLHRSRRRWSGSVLSAAFLAALIVVSVVVILRHQQDRSSIGPSEPQSCPSSYPMTSLSTLYVPSSPVGIAAARTMVPLVIPENAMICRYAYPGGLRPTSALQFTQARALRGSLAGIMTDLAWLPKSIPTQKRACVPRYGSADRYLIGLNYSLGAVWVSAADDSSGCLGSTNGTFSSPVNLGAQVAASFAARHWTGMPQGPPEPCAGSAYGRLGQQDVMVPEGAVLLTICKVNGLLRVGAKRIGLGFAPLIHALNALPVAREYALNSSGAHVRYELIFSYLQGPPVTVQVGSADAVTPGAVDNGTIQTTSAGNVLTLVHRLFS